MVYPGHVLMALGEDISITFEKSREHLADHGISKGSNLSRPVKFRVVKKHLFKLLYRLHRPSMFFYAHGLEVVIHFHNGYVAFVCGHLILT